MVMMGAIDYKSRQHAVQSVMLVFSRYLSPQRIEAKYEKRIPLVIKKHTVKLPKKTFKSRFVIVLLWIVRYCYCRHNTQRQLASYGPQEVELKTTD